jgi:predicted aspartyl protease
MVKSRKVRLGVVAVQIQNPANDKTACIYAFQDTGSQLTLLRKSVADEIGLKGAPIIQSCKGMNSTVKSHMELAELRIRGLKESDTFHLKDVRVTDNVPELPESLPTELDIDSYENSFRFS